MATRIVPDLAEALRRRQFPTVTMWNRLEGRPRTENFDRALRAEVRDALWMLARQWQMGELTGDDAGSPILARVHTSTTRLRAYRAGQADPEPFDDSMPLEVRVEALRVPLVAAGRDIALDLRLLSGRHWLKLLAPLGDFTQAFVRAYPIHVPDPDDPADAAYCAHPEAWTTFAAVAGRRMDGGKLYLHLLDPTHHAWDGIAELDAIRTEVDELAGRFVAWFEALVHQPSGAGAWLPDRLEYRFACSAPVVRDGKPAEQVLVAEEYSHGHLDWYSVDSDPASDPLGADPAGLPSADTQTLLPTPVSFDGMPNTRWWAFEDGRTNFGDIRPDTTDLAKLLLIEFGLVYANDWFLIPHTLPAGSVRTIRGLEVTDVFGDRTWIEPAGSDAADDWQRWSMFRSGDDPGLVLLPTTVTTQESRPVEEVLLIRDEVANMVWGVETVVSLPTGRAYDGRAAARETRAFHGAPPEPPEPAETARVRYQVMNTVPENWIPFIPVHVAGDNREIQLRRAAMPRFPAEAGGEPEAVRPRTSLLREGLDAAPARPYLLHEEEVWGVGVRLTRSYQRTRWRDGRVWVWQGAQKRTGRGQGSSGLAFDRAVELTRDT